MTSGSTWTAQLTSIPVPEWPGFLEAHSGLPGPRANLPLAHDAALAADETAIAVLLQHDGEFPAMCAAAALGRRAADPADEARARALAADPRWRVREGVALGLQLLGDVDIDALVRLVTSWSAAPDPLVVRAAIAAICEPRLLRSEVGATAALAACRTATERLTVVPAAHRRDDDVRTLRQALGYCWSVAVAGDPTSGLETFLALDASDPDVAWVIAQNRRKKRLASLI
ncbi:MULTISPECIES: HEAT repeat domain-containing protein [unclassified Microbacterium]|uniref:HEAT repeat domain-containing protein n=1 Tax=unclassified Microbacterium TaxID=2609290 RepID=UPI00301962FD